MYADLRNRDAMAGTPLPALDRPNYLNHERNHPITPTLTADQTTLYYSEGTSDKVYQVAIG